MIVDYDSKYDEDIKDLLVELQTHLVGLDKEGYNKITSEYRELYFKKTIETINKYQGKILLFIQNNKAVGFVAGVINNDPIDEYDFKAPKRGRIEELVVSGSERGSGIGDKLLKAMEQYLYSVGCEDILLAAFAYNERAVKFYQKHGYNARMLTMSKSKEK